VERTANFQIVGRDRAWPALRATRSSSVFVAVLLACSAASALLASWLPLQVSIVTVFLFAGPHNWFEMRYFLARMPVRFGKSRVFFLTAFSGIAILTLAYASLPLLYNFGSLRPVWAVNSLAIWNSLLLFWLAALVWLRGKNKRRPHWSIAFPVAFALCSINWLSPELFSLAIVYLHPLIALWFLDRHLARNRPQWLHAYRRCLIGLPFVLGLMFWRLTQSAPLSDDNGLFWRITQHAGAELVPQISSHALVTTHVFLEMLHYGVWLIALPLIAPLASRSNSNSRDGHSLWKVMNVPLGRHPRGFPRIVVTMFVLGAVFVTILWVGFAVDYSTTRDIYFTVAIAHVLAEAPFLLKMI